MYKRHQVEKFHNIHQGIHQNNKGENIISIQCQLDEGGYYHDTLLQDGTIMYIGEGGLEKPQQKVIESIKSDGKVHRQYGNLALINAMEKQTPFHVINKNKDGLYEYLGRWIVISYEYSPLGDLVAHYRFFLRCIELPMEYIGEYGIKIKQFYEVRED